MRTREIIEQVAGFFPSEEVYQHLSLEVLLDIRDLLAKSPMESIANGSAGHAVKDTN